MWIPPLPPARAANSCWDRSLSPFTDPVSAKLQEHNLSVAAALNDLRGSLEKELGDKTRELQEQLATLEDSKFVLVHQLESITSMQASLEVRMSDHETLVAQRILNAQSAGSSAQTPQECDSGDRRKVPTKGAGLEAVEERLKRVEMRLTQLSGSVQNRHSQMEAAVAAMSGYAHPGSVQNRISQMEVGSVEERFNEMLSRIQHIEYDVYRPKVLPSLPPLPQDSDAGGAHARELVKVSTQVQKIKGRVVGVESRIVGVERCAKMWLAAEEKADAIRFQAPEDDSQAPVIQAAVDPSSATKSGLAVDVEEVSRAVAEKVVDERVSMEGPGSMRAMVEDVVIQKLAGVELSREPTITEAQVRAPAAHPVQRCLAVLRRK